MAHNHRMQGIANPYLNDRNAKIDRVAQLANQGYDSSHIRSALDMEAPSEPAGLKGRSEMQDEGEYGEQTTDYDLQPGNGANVDRTQLAFGESGHGFSIRKGKAGQ
jgi:hypothetical protein